MMASLSQRRSFSLWDSSVYSTPHLSSSSTGWCSRFLFHPEDGDRSIVYRAAATRLLGEDEGQSMNWILSLILSRRTIDLTFTAAAGVGIAAAAYIASDWARSRRLSKVTTILYLDITACLSIHATTLVYKEKEALSEFNPNSTVRLV